MNKKTNSRKKVSRQSNDLNVKNIVSTKKLVIARALTIFVLFLLILRLLYLQLIDGSYLSGLASKQQIKSEEISSRRGNIYDSTGNFLAITEPVDTISVNPKLIKAKKDEDTPKLKETIAHGLSDIFELDYNEVLEKLNSNRSSETIIKKVEEDKVNELKQWMKDNDISTGINIDEDSKRYYPYGTLASQLIGNCGTDNQGLSGIEYSYDSILTGTSRRNYNC